MSVLKGEAAAIWSGRLYAKGLAAGFWGGGWGGSSHSHGALTFCHLSCSYLPSASATSTLTAAGKAPTGGLPAARGTPFNIAVKLEPLFFLNTDSTFNPGCFFFI